MFRGRRHVLARHLEWLLANESDEQRARAIDDSEDFDGLVGLADADDVPRAHEAESSGRVFSFSAQGDRPTLGGMGVGRPSRESSGLCFGACGRGSRGPVPDACLMAPDLTALASYRG